MFPYYEQRPKIDDYGEFIRAEDFVTAEETANQAQAEVFLFPLYYYYYYIFFNFFNFFFKFYYYFLLFYYFFKQSKEMEVEKPEPPTKSVKELLQLQIECSIHYLNFEGLADGPSTLNILSIILPKKLVFLISFLSEIKTSQI